MSPGFQCTHILIFIDTQRNYHPYIPYRMPGSPSFLPTLSHHWMKFLNSSVSSRRLGLAIVSRFWAQTLVLFQNRCFSRERGHARSSELPLLLRVLLFTSKFQHNHHFFFFVDAHNEKWVIHSFPRDEAIWSINTRIGLQRYSSFIILLTYQL